MGKLNVLVLGDGLLGSEIIKKTNWDYVSRKKDNFDIHNVELYPYHLSGAFDGIGSKKYDVIVNCIANTDTYSLDKKSHWDTNYKFVDNLIRFCNSNEIKLVQISTDYIYSGSREDASEGDVPVHCENWYGYTKLLADGLVQLSSNDYLICRCTHKPKPFPYSKAWTDQIGNFDYVDIIAGIIISSIERNLCGIYNIGTNKKTVYELASLTKEVDPVNSPEYFPKNTSMNISKLRRDMAKPFFSIAIPTYGYNGKGIDYLNYNFSKIESQTFKDYEVVISDHSQDNTIKNVCYEWSDRINIKYVRNNVGRGFISPNLNVSMRHCRGEWIKILFQDDFLYDQNSLQKSKDFIDKNKDAIWIASRFTHSNDGIVMYREMEPTWNNNVPIGENTIGCPSVIMVKNKNLIYFDETFNWLMDCEFYKRMYDAYGKFLTLNEITVVNRTNSGERLSDKISQEDKMSEVRKMIDICQNVKSI